MASMAVKKKEIGLTEGGLLGCVAPQINSLVDVATIRQSSLVSGNRRMKTASEGKSVQNATRMVVLYGL